MRMIMFLKQITHFSKVYAGSFFCCDRLAKFLRVSNWEMEETFNPSATTVSSSWTVYSFLSCLASQASTFDGCLPGNGISIIEAKHLGLFVFHLFRSLDMRDPQKAASFDASILATYLRDWLALTDHAMVYTLWQAAPSQITYWWFHSLRAFLLPY
jgi:hypothetical protein